MAIAFIDLQAQRRRLGNRIESAMAAVLDHGQYINGPEVAKFERGLRDFSGAAHVVTCGNGTDALVLALMAWNVGPGDVVFVPTFTFVATAEAVALVGATPIFVDVLPDTFNMDPDHLAASIEKANADGMRPKCLIVVDLFGQPAAYDAIRNVARRYGLKILADAAQSFGASWKGARVGTLGDITTTSFFPAKPLGCYGDGGALFCEDAETADKLRSLRSHGEGSHRYEHVRIGVNSRLDTLQAAVLIEKLAIFEDELVARNTVAQRYASGLSDVVQVPVIRSETVSAWAQYTLIVENRDAVVDAIRASGIPIAVHYPIALNNQPAYSHYPVGPGGASVAIDLSQKVFSLPMHPYLDEETQSTIIRGIRDAVRK